MKVGVLQSFELNGQAFNVKSLDENRRAVINTGLHVKGGETFYGKLSNLKW
jgi:hypothetical protein